MRNKQQSGNVLFAVFGAIALVGVLSASMMTFMKGPLATSVKLTKMTTAESQMTIGAQVAVMATAAQANNGDCDTDGYVEPMEWRTPTTEPVPTGGGLVPLSLGITKKDPWGTEYGYCVWNHGPTLTGAGCNANMLQGYNSTANTVVALISAGPDKAFTTTCRSFATADVNSDGDLNDATDLPLASKAAETDDDIIKTFTYQEATGASGGLWNLKTGDPATAVISKNIEATGTANLQGGVLLPDKSLITCDATTAGIMARNGTSGIEICDGAAWQAISGGAAGGSGLVLTPNTSNAMDVDGTCGTATCYSANTTFTLTNNLTPAATSVALVVALSNTTNFEKVSDNCNGNTIASGATCQIVVRAKATGNLSYTGLLNITGNNSPFATLDGTASNFPGCNAGGQTTGGYFVGCAVNGSYDLVITPSGCTGGTTNPTCAGGVDTYTAQEMTSASPWVNSQVPFTLSSTYGAQNTADMVAYSGGVVSFPAANYCDSLVYAGYSDWFLPSLSELQTYFYTNKATVGAAASGSYWSSLLQNVTPSTSNNDWYSMNIATGVSANTAATGSYYVRCMRRSTGAATATVDTTPVTAANTLYFTPSVGNTAAETRTSNTITVYGVTQAVNLSISGGTNAQFSKNGAAYTAVATTVTNGDTVTLQATSPAAGVEQTVSVTLGSATTTWKVRTAGNNIIRVFTTSAVVSNGSLSGTGGADSTCTTRATTAGLTGNWIAVLAGSDYEQLRDRLPWNWQTLKNMNGTVVASGINDFMDGSISAPMNYSESNAITASSLVWTGTNSSGIGTASKHCTGWSSSSAAVYGYYGSSSSTASGAYLYTNEAACNNATLRLLCMESNAAGSDVDPDAVSIQPQVTFSSGGTGTSNTVTVVGVTDAVTVTITPSAGTANIIKNGASVGATTTTAGLNETLAFTLTAPAVLGTKNTATINIGPDTYTWWVGYADSTRVAKAFITSSTYDTTASLGGIAGADTKCNTAAAASTYGLSTNWKALISDADTNAADHIPWNWGYLQTVTGVNIVDGGMNDLFDGTLDNQFNINELGYSYNRYVWTGTNASGMRYYPGQTTLTYWANNWTSSSSTFASYGLSSSTTQYTYIGTTSSGNSYALYCIEDVDAAAVDTTPATISPPYPVQVATSSRQSSSAWIVGGMSFGATPTLSVTATGGTPTFTVNGGAEVTSASITNGDSLVFYMDAPATGNTYNKMTMTISGTTVGYWRVWTGDTTGTAVKRVFVTNYLATSSNQGGILGMDALCQTKATAAALGGTWKALVSGYLETDWAVNRIGYDWSTLERIDGVDVVLAGNIWKTATTPLLAPIAISQTGVTVSNAYIATATKNTGKAYLETNIGQCSDYTYGSSSQGNSSRYIYFGSSGTTGSQWIQNDNGWNSLTSYECGSNVLSYMYCIEQ